MMKRSPTEEEDLWAHMGTSQKRYDYNNDEFTAFRAHEMTDRNNYIGDNHSASNDRYDQEGNEEEKVTGGYSP